MPIYHYAAIATKHRPALTPGEVDCMDISVVASMLGVERSTFEVQSVAIIEQRLAAAKEGREVSWDE